MCFSHPAYLNHFTAENRYFYAATDLPVALINDDVF